MSDAQNETNSIPEEVPQVELPPLEFTGGGPTAEEREANVEAIVPSPGYPAWVMLMADAIAKRADLVLLDYSQQAVSVRYQIDGLWHNMPALDRRTGDYMLAAAKKLANLDYRQRRVRQSGNFKAEFMNQKYPCEIVSQGTATGERVAIYLDRPKAPTETLTDLGIRESMRNQVKQILSNSAGLFLYSSLPKDGYTTGWRATLDTADRFMRDFIVIEEASRVEPEVINVTSTTYDSSQNETPQTHLQQILLREPDVLAFTEMPDAATVDRMATLATQEEKLVISRTHGKSAIDALLRVVAMKPNVGNLMKSLHGILYHRTIRKLCENCKMGFAPPPTMLQQLGLPVGRVGELFTRFQPRPEDLVDEQGNPVPLQPCNHCSGLGYAERTGFFELLVLNDALREAVMTNPTVPNLTAVAKRSGFISLRDEGVVLVARGVTSIEELQRVLKKS